MHNTESNRPNRAHERDDPDGAHRHVEELLDRASEDLEALQQIQHIAGKPSQLESFELDQLSETSAPVPNQSMDLLSDVELDMRIELGRTNMTLQEILQLRGGSVVALDNLAGDPVNVYVNNRLVARGEIVVMDNNFCVRVTELVSA